MSDPVCRCRTFALDASQARAYRNEPDGEVWFVHTPVWCGSAPAPGSASPPERDPMLTPLDDAETTEAMLRAALRTQNDLALERLNRAVAAEARAEAAERERDRWRDRFAESDRLTLAIVRERDEARAALSALREGVRGLAEERDRAAAWLRDHCKDGIGAHAREQECRKHAAALRALLGGGDAQKENGR